MNEFAIVLHIFLLLFRRLFTLIEKKARGIRSINRHHSINSLSIDNFLMIAPTKICNNNNNNNYITQLWWNGYDTIRCVNCNWTAIAIFFAWTNPNQLFEMKTYEHVESIGVGFRTWFQLKTRLSRFTQLNYKQFFYNNIKKIQQNALDFKS